MQGELVGPGIIPPIAGVLRPPPGAVVLGAVDARPSWSLALARRNLAASGSSATSTTTPDSVFQGTGRLWAARMCRTRILPPLRSFITTGRWPAARMWMGARGHSSRSFLPCRQLRSL